MTKAFHYPFVIDEFATLAHLMNGKSIARFGDGEYKLMRGRDCVSQRQDHRLADELRNIHVNSPALVGIPTLDPEGAKFEYWEKFFSDPQNRSFFTDRTYHSAFITRPDSAQWIDTPEYWTKMLSIWKDKDVTLVRGSEKSFTKDRLLGARKVTEILCPIQHAYSEIDNLMKEIDGAPLVILACGATATCLADRICRNGGQGIDLGHAGRFMKHTDFFKGLVNG